VSARFAIAAAETVAASALRRAALFGEDRAVARIADTPSVAATLRGKVEFESGEEGREIEILAHLLRTATAETFRDRLAGLDLSGFTDLVADGAVIETGELVTAEEVLRQVGTVPGLAKVLERLGMGDAPSRGEAAAGVEFALEGLYLTRRLSKDLRDDGRSVYRRDGRGR
jgi:magnesium chelatase subunit I